jgi:IS30 family transposase
MVQLRSTQQRSTLRELLDRTEGFHTAQELHAMLRDNGTPVGLTTVYRTLHKGYLSVSAIDFPRGVKFKPRRTRRSEYIPRAVKVGRTYADFLAFVLENNMHSWVEMDTVIGRVGGKVILTIHFTFCNFMAGILLENKTASEMAAKIGSLKQRFVAKGLRFGDILPLLLTDNGGEFSDVFTIENGSDGLRESHLFFCDPMQSCQKPRVEKNHTLFRDIVPKGQSFDNFTQDTVNLVFSHVNSVKRKSLNGVTPFELFCFTYSEEIASVLGIYPIPADLVIQSPDLFHSPT